MTRAADSTVTPAVAELWPGKAYPLGATYDGSGTNFAVFSEAAKIWIAFGVFWLVQVAIILRGLEGIKILESWSAPLLLGGGAALLLWAINAGGGLGHILSESSRLRQGQTPFWTLFPAALTANVGYWATLSLNIPDFTRYAKSQRSQMLGQAFGLPTTMTAFAFIGVAVTSATIVVFGEPVWDPVPLLQ